MNIKEKNIMVIKPVSSMRGERLLLIFSLIGFFFLLVVLLIFFVAPAGDERGAGLIAVTGMMSVILIISGIILYFIYPRGILIFDGIAREVLIKSGKDISQVISFNDLDHFRIYAISSGEYYCSNGSFEDFSDLFFSQSHETVLEKALQLSEMTGIPVVDDDGNIIS